VARVLAQADVGDDQQVGVRGLESAYRQLDDTVVVPGARTLLVLLGRDAEQQHRRDAEGQGLAGLLDDRRERVAVDAGHRVDRPAAVQALLHEQREDEVAGVEARLADEVAQHGRAAEAAHARGREGHASIVARGACAPSPPR
jgi:hypothetical protein